MNKQMNNINKESFFFLSMKRYQAQLMELESTITEMKNSLEGCITSSTRRPVGQQQAYQHTHDGTASQKKRRRKMAEYLKK